MSEINEKLQDILNAYEPAEQRLIQRAFEVASEAHADQIRKSGEPYIIHPLEVAVILKNLHLDANTIAAAFLHDVPEDTDTKLRDLEKEFGSEVVYLVKGMTKLSEVRLKGSHEPNYIENLRKMFIAAAQDLRVVLIKLADRLHNMRTLKYIADEKQESYALETLEIFAPLANRLGMGEIKGELQDLAFAFAYPEQHAALLPKINFVYKEKQEYIEKAIKTIKALLEEKDIEIIDIHGRTKHLYSLYNKLKRYETDDLSNINDLVAVRIIAKSTGDCYAIMGLLHEQFRPMPGKIKDYISLPKAKGYQSLHTTVFGPGGNVLEIQIRTPEMHEYAEHGIAAHWAYNEAGKPKKGFQPSKKLMWIGQLRELQKGLHEDPREFMKTLKLDLFQHRIFCFTPKGDVIDLPIGATAIDFAFTVHSDLGYRCQGVKINKKMSKLNTHLENGDVVEIITSKKTVKISRDWLRIAKTSRAREKIRKRIGD